MKGVPHEGASHGAVARDVSGVVGVIRSSVVLCCREDTQINRTEWRRTWWHHADQSNEMTAYGSTSHVPGTRNEGEREGVTRTSHTG